MAQFIDRTGETGINNEGYKMTIVSYFNNKDMIVRFDNGYKAKCQYAQFKDGRVKNVYHKSVYGVGYFGEGNHEGLIGRKQSNKYKTWLSMLLRCYDSRYHEQQPSYKDCKVCDEWHNFQVFGDWYDENYYEIWGEKTQLDKDIVRKGNKIYSPDNCVFVPQRINKLFTSCNSSRGNLPIGVVQVRNRYSAQCNNDGKRKHLGYHDTPEQAFIAYKRYKESVIQEVANIYMGEIPLKLFLAMKSYEIEIND